jgi:hypothetical protein
MVWLGDLRGVIVVLLSQQTDRNRPIPADLLALRDRLDGLPVAWREELGPFVERALEEARFRGRTLDLARDALASLRVELAAARHQLEASRREAVD